MKTNRSILKEYFKAGAIPTDSNFADLIDSMLNQDEDNISKLPNDALKIVATGTDEALLNFYRTEQNVDKLSWQVKQNPGGHAGLTFSDGTNDRLFIESSSGNVGVGTTTPGTALDVNGDAHLTGPLNIDTNLTVGGNLVIQGTGSSSFAGPVGIGPTPPRTALDTGAGVLSGAPNDYMKAQFAMTGGGTVSWGLRGSGNTSMRLKWTRRFVAVCMGSPVSAARGVVTIVQPINDIPAAQVYDGRPRSANVDGVVLNGWEALYAVHTVGGEENAISFQIVRWTNQFNAPSNWLLVAVVNDEDHTVRLGTGVILSQNSMSSQSSPIPRGVITLWYGHPEDIPDGWAMCDGQNSTPNLSDRFLVAAGGIYKPGDTGGAASVALSAAQMPSHNHNWGDYGLLLHADPNGQWSTSGVDNTVGEPDIVHSAPIQPAGGNQAHENRPPYYALLYIMKL